LAVDGWLAELVFYGMPDSVSKEAIDTKIQKDKSLPIFWYLLIIKS
jgi:hypothetical protein